MELKQDLKDIIESNKHVFIDIIKNNLAWNGEKILIIGDSGKHGYHLSRAINYGYLLACKELKTYYEYVEQEYDPNRNYADKNLIKKLDEISDGSIIICNASTSLGKLGELGKSFRKYANLRNHRFLSATSLGSIGNKFLELYVNAMDVDYDYLETEALRIKRILDSAKEVRITTKAGTDLVYNVEGVEARVNTGVYKEPGKGGNLPGAETYTAPNGINVNGVVVVDVSSKVKKKTQIISEPIVLTIKDGRVVKIDGGEEANVLKKTLVEAEKNSKRPENVTRIAELGIGLNKRATILGAMIIDEKVYGTAHIALGSNYWFGGDIRVNIHLDQVFRDPVILVDGKPLQY